MGILKKLREGASKRFAEQKQLALQRSAANKVISERARAEAYQEREKQEIKLAREREKIRADAILNRGKARLQGGGSGFGSGFMNIAQNYTKNAQSSNMIDIMGISKQPPNKKKVVRYVKVKPKRKRKNVKRR